MLFTLALLFSYVAIVEERPPLRKCARCGPGRLAVCRIAWRQDVAA